MEGFELDPKHLEMAGIDPNDTGDTGDNNDADNQSVQEQASSSQGGESNQQSQQQASQADGQGGQSGTSDKQDGGNQQGKKEQGQGSANPPVNNGDLRLPNGEIVKAGAERRHYENARMFRAENVDLKNQLNTANQRFQNLETKYNTLNDTVKQIGFEDPQRVTAAVRLYKDLASDPVGTTTKLLAELKAKGHTFDGIGGQVDTLAIQNLIADHLPQQQQQQGPTPEQLQQQAQEEAAREATEFLGQFPDARMHEEIIANILSAEFQAGREPSLREVYFKLRQSAINNGLDWNSPLGPQIEARKQAGNQQQQQQQGTQKPFTNARAAHVDTQSEHIDPLKTGNGASRDDVILAAMRESGINYQR